MQRSAVEINSGSFVVVSVQKMSRNKLRDVPGARIIRLRRKTLACPVV